MAGTFILTFAARETLSRVISLATEEFSLIWGLKDEITKLRESLIMLEAVLRDADHPGQQPGEAVKLWVKKLVDIAQQADDVLDDYGYELLRREVVRNKMMKKVKAFFSLSNPAVFRDKMAHRIRKINNSLDTLRKEASFIGLIARAVDPTTSRNDILDHRETYSKLEDERNIIGREDVLADTIEALTRSNKSEKTSLPVLAIVGMGGLGKTTLAKSIYHAPEISSHFDKRIWICVSTPFEVKSILRGILEAVKPEKAALQSMDAINNILQEELQIKKYLLILDDVWNEDAHKWKKLMECLPKNTYNQGSIILVTTRSEKVAEIVETLPRCDLRKLSDGECWLILKDRAIPDGTISIPEDQERAGKEIAKKCGGVPLVAKVLGDILRSKSSNGWISIMDSEIWELPEGEERIMSVLKLSFDELNCSSLKQCFASCSMFIKDAVMEKADLVQLWMAHGWLNPTQTNKEMEDVGHEYFQILARKSLFQDVKTDYKGTTCKMHDLVHDLAQSVSKMENSRSLFSEGETLGSTLLEVRSLRVLNLYKAEIDHLPDSIGILTHLRYLNVMETQIKSFPDSLGKLLYLETFKMPYHVEEFPKMIANMTNLRHIYFGKYVEVPVTLLGRLTNLRSIPLLKLSKESGAKIEDLGELNHLRDVLSIHNLENVRDGEAAAKAKLVNKKHIKRLNLHWENIEASNNVENQDNVLGGLKPHCNLEFLKIYGFMGGKFPSWFLDANNLKEIILHCDNCESVPTLGHLPNLTLVRMYSLAKLRCLGIEFYGSDRIPSTSQVFPALRSLSICAGNLIDWVETGTIKAFPCLEVLCLYNCKQLTSTPRRFPSLKNLEIEGLDSGIPIATILSNELTTLTHLKIMNAKGLATLPAGTLSNNKNLESLRIRNCEELSCIDSTGFDCYSLKKVYISDCPKLRYLPNGLLSLSLKVFHLDNCNRLECIPIPDQVGLPSLQEMTIIGCSNLSSLPDGLTYCTSLQKLEIENCPKIMYIPIPAEGFPSLWRLRLSRCHALSSLPSGLSRCTSLVELSIKECAKVTSIPVNTLSTTLRVLTLSNIQGSRPTLCGFTSLCRLSIRNCPSSQIDLQYLVSLQELQIFDCPNLETVASLEKLTLLNKLEFLNCFRLTCLPSLEKLTSLHTFKILRSSRLTSLPGGLAMDSQRVLNQLKSLSIGAFWNELESFPPIQVLPQLQSLYVEGWPKLKSFPTQIQSLTSLTYLSLFSFDGVEDIPDWLGNLTSLKDLRVRDCKNLLYLPSVKAMRRLTKLERLSIYCCAILKERCREDNGPEWPKISHIKHIQII